MILHFSKYHGTGNDFVMIDGRAWETDLLNKEQISMLCNRRFGIGADGLIILQKSLKLDFTMRYYNADGKEGSMCGNGGRCIVAFAHSLGITGLESKFEGIDGNHEASILLNGDVRLRLQDVIEIEAMEDGYLLNTGSPHFVKLQAGIDKLDVAREGAAIRKEKRFAPSGVNVNFLEGDAASAVMKVRTFERGVEAETFSCGTGVTASAICAQHHFKTDIFSYHIDTLGGRLNVSFRESGPQKYSDVYLSGPAKKVYTGEMELDG